MRIRIFATSVTASDCLVRALKFGGWRRPFFRAAFGVRAPRAILGIIASGEVESVGRDVTAFKPGDQVFGMDGFRAGTYAEKVCWPASAALAIKPSNLTFEEAAAIPYGGLLASHFMRRLNVRQGQRVLIYGASGAIGTSAVQLARHRGAEVTGVCSTANLDLVRSLGAASDIAAAAGDPTLTERTWVLLTEAPDGGWGLNGHANTNPELITLARAQIAEIKSQAPA